MMQDKIHFITGITALMIVILIILNLISFSWIRAIIILALLVVCGISIHLAIKKDNDSWQ